MTTLRTAAQQALEALKDDQYRMVETAEGHWEYKTDLAIAALEAALAQPQGRKTGKPRNATTRLGVVCFEAYARSYVGSNRWDIAAEAVRAAIAKAEGA